MTNTSIRSTPCPQCGAELVWTQNASKSGDTGIAAYACQNGHVIDPSQTRQCPACGIHDTVLVSEIDGQQEFRCAQCGDVFKYPRQPG